LALATKTPFSTNPRWPNTDKKSRKSEKPELLTSAEKVRRSSAKSGLRGLHRERRDAQIRKIYLGLA